MAGGKKEHVDKVRTSKFNRQRAETPTLRANTGSDGYVFTCPSADNTSVNAAGQCEFHHVLPISSIQDAAIRGGKKDENLDFIHKCMAKTTWDINTQPNMLGLPTKGPFEDADRKSAAGLTAGALSALNPMAGAFGALPNNSRAARASRAESSITRRFRRSTISCGVPVSSNVPRKMNDNRWQRSASSM